MAPLITNPEASIAEITGYDGDRRKGWPILAELKQPTKVEEFYCAETIAIFEQPEVWRHTELIAEKLLIQATIVRDEFNALMTSLPPLSSEYFNSLAMRRDQWWKKFRG
jgi:hypothetical protein